MPYKTTKKEFWINVKKSSVVGIIVLLLDIIGHISFTARPESSSYYFLKPFISGYVAYLMYAPNKKLTNLTIAIFSGIFAGLHGIYYRILDFAYGFPFWSRVQDVVIGSVVFLRSNFGSSIMIWALLHGLPFFVGVKIANFLEKKEWLN